MTINHIGNQICSFTSKTIEASHISNNGSAVFDGTNDFVNVNTLASDISLTAGTISLWGRITQTSNNESFFNCSDGASGANKIQLWYSTSSGALKATYKQNSSVISADLSISNSDIVGAGWFHVVMTYDVSANSIKLYYNGSLAATSEETLTVIDSSSVTLDRVRIGKNSNADNTFLAGYVDELAYFARVLTADEISSIYKANGTFDYIEDTGLRPSDNLLKVWLRFGDGRAEDSVDSTACIFDMSNATLGSEKIANGTFDTGSEWSLTNASIDGGRAIVAVPEGGAYSALFQSNASMNSALVSGEMYRLKATVQGEPELEMRFQDNANNTGGLTSGNGTVQLTGSSQNIEIFWVANNDSNGLNIARNTAAAYEFIVDNVSVRKVEGNFAFADGALINQDNLPG